MARVRRITNPLNPTATAAFGHRDAGSAFSATTRSAGIAAEVGTSWAHARHGARNGPVDEAGFGPTAPLVASSDARCRAAGRRWPALDLLPPTATFGDRALALGVTKFLTAIRGTASSLVMPPVLSLHHVVMHGDRTPKWTTPTAETALRSRMADPRVRVIAPSGVISVAQLSASHAPRAPSASVPSQDSQARDPACRWSTHSVNGKVIPTLADATTSVTGCPSTNRSSTTTSRLLAQPALAAHREAPLR